MESFIDHAVLVSIGCCREMCLNIFRKFADRLLENGCYVVGIMVLFEKKERKKERNKENRQLQNQTIDHNASTSVFHIG